MTVDEPVPVRRRIPFWLKVVAVPAVILVGTLAFLFGYVLQPATDNPREDARQACLDAVRNQLAAPGAQFFEVSELSAGDIAGAVAGKPARSGSEDFFTVTGKVQAPNTVGSSGFLCTAERNGEGWSAEAAVF